MQERRSRRKKDVVIQTVLALSPTETADFLFFLLRLLGPRRRGERGRVTQVETHLLVFT